MPFKSALFLTACIGLAACSSSASQQSKKDAFPGSFIIELPRSTPSAQPQFLSASIVGRNDNGTIKAAHFRLSKLSGKPFGSPKRMAVPAGTARALDRALATGSGEETVTRFAIGMARQTYCRTGPITKAKGITRINDPDDLATILAESKRQGRDVIPAHIKGTPAKAVRYDTRFSSPKWTARLECDAPNPYG